jgi:hypothetical protein
MPIDLSAVNWLYVVILSGFAFVAALLGSLIAFRNRFVGAILAGILFGAAFVFWTYYPHPNVPGPIRLGSPISAAPISAAPATAAPVSSAPTNPVSTIGQAPSPPPSGEK